MGQKYLPNFKPSPLQIHTFPLKSGLEEIGCLSRGRLGRWARVSFSTRHLGDLVAEGVQNPIRQPVKWGLRVSRLKLMPQKDFGSGLLLPWKLSVVANWLKLHRSGGPKMPKSGCPSVGCTSLGNQGPGTGQCLENLGLKSSLLGVHGICLIPSPNQ